MATRSMAGVATNGKAANRRGAYPSGAAMLSELAWEKIGRSLRLSERKLQVVRAVFDDRTELSIAATLDISANTVHTPMERMYGKLAVRDRGQLILRVVNEFLTLTAAPGGSLPSICGHRTAGRCSSQPR